MHQNYIKYNTKTASKSTPSFTGKERDSETGFSYFGARYYDSDILTGWLSVDPMADKHHGYTPSEAKAYLEEYTTILRKQFE